MLNRVQSNSSEIVLDICNTKRLRLMSLKTLLVVVFICTQAVAEDEKKPEADWSWQQAFIRSNLYASQVFNGLAEKIDLFLSRRDKTEHRNETSVRIVNSTNSSEGQPVTNLTNLNINLRLPNLEEYWQVKFSSYDDSEESRGVQKGYLRQTPREKNYGATIGLFKKLGNVRTSFQPRIELQDPLRVSHSIRFESVADLKTYEVNPKLEFFGTPDKGTGIFGAINLKFQLSNYYTLAVINEGEYQEKLALFSSNSGLSFMQSVGENSSLSYNIFFNSNSRPAYHLEAYSLSVSWSEVIYKKILDYQIVPHLDFPYSNSFKGIAGVTLNIGLNF